MKMSEADIIYVHERTWELEDDWSLTVILTDEGIVFDVRDDNGHQQASTYLFVDELEELARQHAEHTLDKKEDL
jgi:hypothetical protein